MTVVALVQLMVALTNLATAAIEKMSPEQVQGFIERHEQRIDWVRARIDRITD